MKRVLSLSLMLALLSLGTSSCDDDTAQGPGTLDGTTADGSGDGTTNPGDTSGDGTSGGDTSGDDTSGDGTSGDGTSGDGSSGDTTGQDGGSCPSDRTCGSSCCEAPGFCLFGACRDDCPSGETCGATDGICCPTGLTCLSDGATCGLECPTGRVACGPSPTSQVCCEAGEVCNNNACATDCGSDILCGDACCTAGQEMCMDGQCVAQCDDAANLCGAQNELCCDATTETCLANTCVTLGDTCTRTEQCAFDEYCEPILGACVPRDKVEICEFVPPPGVFSPRVGCRWTPAPGDPNAASRDVVMNPVVGNLTDDNGDGLTNTDDTPDIAFLSYDLDVSCCNAPALLRIVSGACNADGTMNTIATLGGSGIMDNSGGLAIGNLDGDVAGEHAPEIVAILRSQGTIAWKRTSDDGSTWTEMWRNSSHPNSSYSPTGTQPSLADLNGDGLPEVIVGNVVLNGQDGTLVWDGNVTSNGSGGHGNNSFIGPVTSVADLNLDGIPEVLAGNTAYRGDTGAVAWTYTYTSNNSSCTQTSPRRCDGYTASANFDLDPEGEVVIVRLGEVFLLEHNGTLAKKAQIPSGGCGGNEGGPPTIADFDGDGRPEIGTASSDFMVVVDWDCDGTPLPAECDSQYILWKTRNEDCTSRVTGSSVFDFEGDGKAEVIYADENTFRIFDGTDGTILYEDLTFRSHTRLEMPLVADVDNDGKSEIVIPENSWNQKPGGGPGVEVWEDASNNWVRGRRIWNQHSYHVTNVTEDGQIPTQEEINWLNGRLNNFRQNIQPGGIFDAPDLTIDDLTVDRSACISQSTLTVLVTLKNNGALGVPAGILLAATAHNNVTNEDIFIGAFPTTTPLFPGNTEQLSISWQPPAGWSDFVIRVTVDDDGSGNGQYNECDEANNDGSTDAQTTCAAN